MSLMWMPAQTTTPPRSHRAQRGGHELADGGEDDRRVERLGRGAERVAGPLAARARSAKACDASSSARVKAKTRRPWWQRDLGDDVRGGAEAVEARAAAASPVMRSARWPISPAHSSGAASRSPKPSGSGKQKRASATACSA